MGLPWFCLMPISVPEPCPRPQVTFSCQVILGSSRLWWFLRLVFNDLDLEEDLSGILQKVPQVGSQCHESLMIRLRLWVWVRMTPEVKGHSHHILSEGQAINTNCNCWWELGHLAEVPLWVTLFCPPLLCSLGGSRYVSLSLRSGHWWSPSWMVAPLHRLFGIIPYGRSFHSPTCIHLFSYLFTSVWTHGYLCFDL